MNLAQDIESNLPPEIAVFLKKAGRLAQSRGESLYLVGGAVRDLRLRRTVRDVDLVLEGDAVALAQQLAAETGSELAVHRRFGTATLRWDSWCADLVTARAESYPRPGALPVVWPGALAEDLARRDFSINAIAAALHPERYGEIIDLHHGLDDIDGGVIRILHADSFIDDATRIWRTLRYEQRLGFQIEPLTLGWLRRDLPMLKTVSGERIRRELELVLAEDEPEKMLRRAAELGVLACLHPALRGDDWLEQRFARARKDAAPRKPDMVLYLALLCLRLEAPALEELILVLKLPKETCIVLRDTVALNGRLDELARAETRPGEVYGILHGLSATALRAHLLSADDENVRSRIRLYLKKLRHVRPVLTSGDLEVLGVPNGPALGEFLDSLRAARLNGEANSRADEESLVRRLVSRRYLP